MKKTITELKAALASSDIEFVQVTVTASKEVANDGTVRNKLDPFVVDRVALLDAIGGIEDDDSQD